MGHGQHRDLKWIWMDKKTDHNYANGMAALSGDEILNYLIFSRLQNYRLDGAAPPAVSTNQWAGNTGKGQTGSSV